MKNRIRINPRREIRRLVKIVPQLTGWLFGACVLSAHAATFVSSQDGLWGAPATWWPTPGIPGPDDTVYVNHIVEAEQSYACAYLHLNNTLRIYPGYSLTVGGGIWGEEGYPRVIGSWGTFINNGTFGTSANYPAFTIDRWVTWQNAGAFNHSAGVLTLDGVWRNQPGASYNVSVDGDFLVGSGTVENYGAFAKTGADGVARVTTTFCNYGGMINVQRGGLAFGGGGVSSNGVVNVAAGADLDMCGSNTLQVYGTVTGYCPGRIGWSGGKLLLNDPVVFDFPNMYWAGGSFQGYIKNTGLMILEADTQKECYVGTLDNHGTIRQTNTGPLYLNKYVNVCRVLNQPGAVYEIQSDGTNITGSSINDLDDAFYNYGTLRKTGGNGLSRIAATFCNYGGTVEVQAGTLVLAGGGISSNGVFNASVGAVLELVGGNNPQFYGTFSGSGQGWVGWSSGRIVPNTSVVFDFANGIHWAGGSFQGYIKNTGLMILEADTQKECYVGTLDNYGTIRQTNSGPLYLNKYAFVSRVLNQPGAVYEIQSDGTNITGSSINDLNDAAYNYGTLRKTGGNGLSRITATFCNYGGTVEALTGTLEFTHYNHSNGVIRLNGGNVVLPVCTLYGGLLSGTGTVAVAGTLTSAATTAPGLSTGTLNIQGNFAQTATGTLAIELGGRDPGQFDLLAVTGNATLNGTLCVTVSPLFMPSKGDQFRILTCGNLAGAFSVTNMPPGLSLSYNSTSVVLAVTGPLPVTLLNPAVAGTNFTFSFMSQTNQTYTVEYKDDLNTTNWYFLESVAGTGALLECVIPMTNSAQRFFRVRQS